ncbi:MAG: Calx-beta domain-containing protein [Cyanobacteria bacterium J06560_2]
MNSASIRIEAESIQSVDTYRIEGVSAASQGKVLSLRGGSSGEIGSATFEFTGAPGAYDIVVGYFDESDGIGRFEIVHNAIGIDNWQLDQDLGSKGAKAATFTTRTIANAYGIETGDSFTITGFEAGSEHVRLDYIEFIPKAAEPQPRPGSFTFSTANYELTEAGASTVPITIERVGGSSGSASVTVQLADGTATAPDDYNNAPIVVDFADGETTKTITIPVIDDGVSETSETVSAILAAPTGGTTLGAQSTTTISILDNDAPGTLSFEAANFEMGEDGTALSEISIVRTGGSSGAVSATVQLTDGTATAPADYSSAPITVTFANGKTVQTVTVPIVDDATIEGRESLSLTLGNLTGGAGLGSQTTAELTIVDNDAAVSADPIRIEAESIQSTETYRIEDVGVASQGKVLSLRGRAKDETGSATFEFAGASGTYDIIIGYFDEADGTAQLEVAHNATVLESWTLDQVLGSNGAKTKTFVTRTVADAYAVSTGDSFTVSGIENGGEHARIDYIEFVPRTVQPPQPPQPSQPGTFVLDAASYEIDESGNAVVPVAIERIDGTSGAASVTVQLTEGSATASNDYTDGPIVVNFADGESRKTVSLPIIDDGINEPSETFSIALANPTNGTAIGPQNVADIVVLDDDAAGILSFAAPTFETNEDGTGSNQVSVIRTNGTAGVVSATVQFTDGTATAPSDYSNTPITVTFADGETSQTLTIPTVNDSLDESNETLSLSLVTPTNGAEIGTQSTAEVTIVDDDEPTIPDTPGGELSTVTGELKTWHKVTVDFEGPSLSETGAVNPFRDLRLDVTFTHATTGETFVVPGYFAADGDAANTGASEGNIWRAHFSPPSAGEWRYEASFRAGDAIAASLNPTAGRSGGAIDGETGSFSVSKTNKSGTDLRSKGRLEYVNEHYLQYAETGEYYLKSGINSPENFLAYQDFDGTFDNKGGFLHKYEPHLTDWQAGDPTWQTDKGKAIIGAVNYLASEGVNSVHFMTLTLNGDTKDTWPWISPGEGDRDRFDVSKLDQWQVVFDHMQAKGINLHLNTQENENDQLLNGGNLGVERALYYRELISRFGHHNAVTWNLGEENTNTEAQQKSFSDYFKAVDPYDHPVAIHSYPNRVKQVYTPLLGHPTLEGMSLQIGDNALVHETTLEWAEKSLSAGRPWIINIDETRKPPTRIVGGSAVNTYNDLRDNALWGNLMAGGAGAEWYFGGKDDKTIEDFRTRQDLYRQTRYAREFFETHLPFLEMENLDDITVATNDYVLGKAGEVYAVYLPDGGTTNIALPEGTYDVRWYDSRAGGDLLTGSVNQISGNGLFSLGQAPYERTQDWVALIQNTSIGSESAIGSSPEASV